MPQGGSTGKAITLRRNGALDPLPSPGEKAGPDSRESYSIKVTPEGVEVEGRSSAAVYYGVQTLIQLVEARLLDYAGTKNVYAAGIPNDQVACCLRRVWRII